MWAILLAFLPLCCTNVFADCSDNVDIGLEADSYHWTKPTTIEPFMYREWWFYTIRDPENDLSATVSVALSDPGKYFHLDAAVIALMVWENAEETYGAGEYNIMDTYSLEQVKLSNETAELVVSDGKTTCIQHVVNKNTYYLDGSSQDGKTKWSLTFTGVVAPMQELFGVGKLANLDWINYFPSAKVSGWFLTAKGNNYTLSEDTIGYHDHNYGSWPDPAFNWIWANFNDIKVPFAVTLGAYRPPELNVTIGYLFFRFGEQHAKLGTLCGVSDEFSLIPLHFNTTDKGRKFCTHSLVKASNDEWKIEMEFRSRLATLNPGGYGLGLLVFEQMSWYEVSLWKKDGTLVYSGKGYGFNEWSDL